MKNQRYSVLARKHVLTNDDTLGPLDISLRNGERVELPSDRKGYTRKGYMVEAKYIFETKMVRISVIGDSGSMDVYLKPEKSLSTWFKVNDFTTIMTLRRLRFRFQ